MSNHLDMCYRLKNGIYGIHVTNVTTYLGSRDQFNKKCILGQAKGSTILAEFIIVATEISKSDTVTRSLVRSEEFASIAR